MVAYRLPLVLLTYLTCLGFLSSPSQSAISRYSTDRPTMASSVDPVILLNKPADLLILAQENTSSEQHKFKFLEKLPMGLILLSVGSIIVTGGAIFIMIKLIGQQSEPEVEAELPPEPIVEQSSPYLTPPQNLPLSESSASGFQPEDAEPIGNNGYINAPLRGNESQEKPSIPPRTHSGEQFLIADQSRLPQLDRVEQLILALQNQDPTKRHQTLWELGQKGDSRAIQPLVDLIYTSDSKQRSLILAALSEIGTRTLKPMSQALTLSLQDENAEVRKNAIRDLTRIYDLVYQMNQLLQRAANDPDTEVRETARWAADKLSRIRPLPTVQDEPHR